MRTNLISTLVILLIIIGGLVVIYVTDTYGLRSQLDSHTARAGVQVLEGEVQNRVLKEFGLFTEKTISLPVSGNLIDYAPQGYAITFNTERGVWSIESLVDQKVLATNEHSKLWLSTSPNNRYLVYAQREALESKDRVQEAIAVYDPAQWRTHVVDPASGETLAEVVGSMPRFFERAGSTHLLYLLPNEVRIRVLGTQKESALSYAIDGLWPVEVSKDGKYIALFNTERMSYEVFTFELTNGSITLTPLPPMPLQVRILAFEGSDLYALVRLPEQGGVQLVVIDLEHPESYTVLSDRTGLEYVRKIIPAL